MKRLITVSMMMALVAASGSGCCGLGPWRGCGPCGGGACGEGPLGCGGTYWGDWPNCRDSCDNCGQWVGWHWRPRFPFLYGQSWYDPCPSCTSCYSGCDDCGGCSSCGGGPGYGPMYGPGPMHDDARLYESPFYGRGPYSTENAYPNGIPYYDGPEGDVYENSYRPAPTGAQQRPVPTRYPTMSRQPYGQPGCKHCETAGSPVPRRF